MEADRENFDAMKRSTTHRRTRSAAWILIAVLVFSCLVEATPAVLCIAGDGHTDVEYGLAGCCVLVADSRDQTLAPLVLGGQGCEDCADLGLEQASLRACKKNLPLPDAIVHRLGQAQNDVGHVEMPERAPHIGIEALITTLSSVVLLT